MADAEYDGLYGYDRPAGQGRAQRILHLTGALTSVALVVGFWRAPITTVLNLFLLRAAQLQLAFGLLLAVALVAR